MSREIELIRLIGRMTGRPGLLADDTYYDPATRRIDTTDMLVEGRHFDLRYFSPADLGWRAAAANISDIAATGGRLKHLLVSIGLPEDKDAAWVEGLYDGLLAACRQFGGEIVGGDTVGSPLVVINVAAMGECPEGHTPGRRNGAQVGDFIVTTGHHGLSDTGLKTLQAGLSGFETAKAAHLRPQPRIAEGLLLSETFSRYALMDSSDGLADALIKLAQASGCCFEIDATKIPIHPEVSAFATAQKTDSWEAVLYGGEDFQLVAAVPLVNEALLAHFTVIGRVMAAAQDAGAWLFLEGQRQALSLDKTYHHFGAASHG